MRITFAKKSSLNLVHHYWTLSLLGKIFSTRNFKIFFSYFIQQIGFDSSCKLSPKERQFMQIVSWGETIYMKYQSLFSWKMETNITILSSAESVQRVPVKIKIKWVRKKKGFWVWRKLKRLWKFCLSKFKIPFYPKYCGRQTWANNLNTDQTTLQTDQRLTCLPCSTFRHIYRLNFLEQWVELLEYLG